MGLIFKLFKITYTWIYKWLQRTFSTTAKNINQLKIYP